MPNDHTCTKHLPSITCYTSAVCRCRCTDCRKANAEAARRNSRRRAARARAGQVETPHGLQGYNNYRCRCDVCTSAARTYQNTHRQEVVA